MENVSFFCPIFLGHQKRRLLLPKQEAALWEGTQWCKGGTEKAEAAKLQDAGISLKQCPENERQKKAGLLNCEDRRFMGCALGQRKRNTKR
jgi:hypothetical protein